MLLATRKTKNNLVRTVLASSVLISSMAYISTAHAVLTAVGAPTNAATPNDGYSFTADVLLTVPDNINIGQTGNVSIQNNAGGINRGSVTFVGNSYVGEPPVPGPAAAGSIGIGGAGAIKALNVTGAVSTVTFSGAVTSQDIALSNGQSNFQAAVITTQDTKLTNSANAAFTTTLNARDLDISGVDHTVTVGGVLTLTGNLVGAGTGTSTLGVTGASAITGDIDASQNFQGTFKGNVAVANIFSDNTSILTFTGQANPTANIEASSTSTVNLNGGGQANGAVLANDNSTINVNANYIMDTTLKLSNGAAPGSRATVNVAATKTLQVDGAITVNKNAILNVLGTLDNDAVNTVDLTLVDTATANLNIAQIGRDIIQAAGTTVSFTGGLVDARNLDITGAGNVNVSKGADIQLTGQLINGGGTNANFLFDLGNTDTPGVINVVGNAAIAATQTVTITNYNLGTIPVNGSVTKNLITAGGGAGVEPTNLTPTNPFINFELLMAGNDLTLKMSRQTPAGLDGNASNLGNIFSQLAITNAPGELGVLLDNLGDIATSPEKLNEDLAEIAPQGINGGIVDSSFGVTNETFDLFSQRISELRAGLDSYHTGYAAGHMTESGHGTWVKVFGNHADQGRRGNIAGYTGETWGLAVGTDMMITERHLIGVSGSFGSTDVNFDSQRGGTDINSYQGAFYGSWNVTTPLFVNWMASAAYNKYKETQLISVGGFNQASLGEFDGWQYGARAELGYVFGEQCFHIVPTVDLTYNHVSFDSFRQKGNSTANQVIDYGSVSALLAGVGVKFSYDYEMQKALLQPEVHANVSYDIIGDEIDANARFVGFGTSYNVQGASVKRTDYNLGLSLTTYGHSGLGFSISYDYDWKTHYHAHSGFFRIRYEW